MTANRAIVVVNGAITLQRSSLYANYCAVLNGHHVCPLSWFERAGRPVETPIVALSPSDHMNVHAAIDGILAGHDVSRLPPRAVGLAREGLAIAASLGLTPAPTL